MRVQKWGPLYLRDPTVNADRVYTMELLWDGSDWIVSATWGRRGTTVQRGKPKAFRSKAQAVMYVEAQLTKKRAKGYTADPDTTVATATEEDLEAVAARISAAIRTVEKAKAAPPKRSRSRLTDLPSRRPKVAPISPDPFEGVRASKPTPPAPEVVVETQRRIRLKRR